MKKIKFTRDVYVDGAKVHKVGDEVDPAPELQKHVRRGNAVEVDVEETKAQTKGKSKGKK